MTELPEELKKAELTTQQVVEQIDALHRDPLFGLLHVANPELRQADYLLGKWLPSSVVASFLEDKRKELKERLCNCSHKEWDAKNNFDCLCLNCVTIDAVLGGEEK